MAKSKQIDYQKGLKTFAKSYFPDVKLSPDGLEYLSNLLHEINSRLIENFHEEYETTSSKLTEHSFLQIAQTAVEKTFEGNLQSFAVSEAQKQLSLLEAGCLRYSGGVPPHKQKAGSGKQGGGPKAKRELCFKNGIDKLCSKTQPGLKVDKKGKEYLSSQLYNFIKLVGAQVSEGSEEKGKLQPKELKNALPQFFGEDVLRTAVSEANKCLVLYENGLLDFRVATSSSKLKSSTAVSDEDEEATRKGVLAAIKGLIPEYTQGFKDIDSEVGKYISYIYLSIGKYLAKHSAREADKEEQNELGHEDLQNSVNETFPEELRQHAIIHALSDLESYQRGEWEYVRKEPPKPKKKSQPKKDSKAQEKKGSKAPSKKGAKGGGKKSQKGKGKKSPKKESKKTSKGKPKKSPDKGKGTGDAKGKKSPTGQAAKPSSKKGTKGESPKSPKSKSKKSPGKAKDSEGAKGKKRSASSDQAAKPGVKKRKSDSPSRSTSPAAKKQAPAKKKSPTKSTKKTSPKKSKQPSQGKQAPKSPGKSGAPKTGSKRKRSSKSLSSSPSASKKSKKKDKSSSKAKYRSASKPDTSEEHKKKTKGGQTKSPSSKKLKSPKKPDKQKKKSAEGTPHKTPSSKKKPKSGKKRRGSKEGKSTEKQKGKKPSKEGKSEEDSSAKPPPSKKSDKLNFLKALQDVAPNVFPTMTVEFDKNASKAISGILEDACNKIAEEAVKNAKDDSITVDSVREVVDQLFQGPLAQHAIAFAANVLIYREQEGLMSEITPTS